jgi:uncharacterized membrane protein
VLNNRVMNYTCEAAIGAVSGLRTFTGPAIISEAAHRKFLKLKGTPLAWLASDRAAHVSTVLAVGEIIADKLPFMPNRTEAPSLVGRFVAGAACGVAMAGRRKKKELVMGAIVGGAAALAAAWLGNQYRRRVTLPPIAAALLEDGVAIGVGSAVVARLCA